MYRELVLPVSCTSPAHSTFHIPGTTSAHLLHVDLPLYHGTYSRVSLYHGTYSRVPRQVLPAADAANFMKAYAAFNGTNTEADVIKYAGVLLSRKDLLAFIDRPDRYVCVCSVEW